MIVIDSGHGGSDSGAIGNGMLEKDYTLLISKYLFDRFNELGIPVKMTRTTDETLTPSERVNRILNSFGNNKDVLVISNHLNAGGGEGAEVIYSIRNDDTLSKNILNEFTNINVPVRKAYQRRSNNNYNKDYYFIHRDTGITEPIIIEYGFIDNINDSKRIKNDYKKYAEAVVKAVTLTKGYNYEEPKKLDRYIVKKGDTLWSIAKQFNISVNDIKKANNLSNNLLYINQELRVPNYYITEDSNITHVIKKGDTLYSISKLYNIPISEIISINNLQSEILIPGNMLKIPKSNQIISNDQELIISEGSTYTVLPGDTLYSISKKFNVPINDIISENNLSTDILSIGTNLLIPNNISNIDIHIVEKGDTLWFLAKEYNTTIDTIKKLNNLSTDILIEGTKLQIKKNTNY